jgi:hypothetical protein
LEDDEHTSQARTVRIELRIQEVAKLVCATAAAAAAAEISHGMCNKILSDLNMSCATQHTVPCFLMEDQRDDRMSACGDLIDIADKDGIFLNQIMTGDEIWCFKYDPQLKR